MNFYRYETVQYASLGMDGDYTSSKIPNPKLELRTYDLIKETTKGFWIGYGEIMHYKRWISKTAKKRFAYPTKEEALNGYITRTKKRMEIMEYQLSSCKMGLGLADMEKEKY
jgi:hypothetical protein